MKHIGPISGIASNDKYIATAGYDSRLILWDKYTDTALKVFFHDHLVNQCEFSKCGKYLVSSSSDYSARIWSLDDLKLVQVICEETDDIEHSTFSPDSKFVALASLSGKIHVFNLETGKILSVEAHIPYAKSLVWSNDGKFILSCGEDGIVKKWNAANLELIDEITFGETHTDTIITLDDSHFLIGNDKGELIVLSDSYNKYDGHLSGVKRLAFHQSSNKIISVGYDNILIVWRFNKGELRKIDCFDIPSIIWTRSCTFVDENTIAFGTFGSSYSKFDLRHGKWNLENIEEIVSINSLVIDDHDLYTVGDSGIIKKNNEPVNKVPSLCNFVINTEVGLLTGGHSGEIFHVDSGEIFYKNCCPFNTAGTVVQNQTELLLTGDYNGNVHVFKYINGELELLETLKIFCNAVKSIKTRNGKAIAVCATGDVAEITFDSQINYKLYPNVHNEVVNDIAYVNDHSFCTVGRDKKLVIWNNNHHTCLDTPHLKSIKSVASCGRFICTGDYSGTAHVFDIENMKWSETKRVSSWGISSIEYSNNNQTFFMGSYNGRVYEHQASAQ